MPGSRWKGEGEGKEKGESVMCAERVRAEWGRSWLLWWDGSCCLGLGMLRPALSNHAQSRDKMIDSIIYGLVRMPRNPIILRAHLTTAPLETTNCSPLTPPSPRLYLQVP